MYHTKNFIKYLTILYNIFESFSKGRTLFIQHEQIHDICNYYVFAYVSTKTVELPITFNLHLYAFSVF